MVRLLILSGKQAGQVVLARRFPFHLGRAPAAGLVLAEPGVWDVHCRIEHRPGSGFVLVPAPDARTLVNDEPVDGERPLPNAAEIALGGVRVRFLLDDPIRRRLGMREAVTWLFLTLVLAGQAWLIWKLPR